MLSGVFCLSSEIYSAVLFLRNVAILARALAYGYVLNGLQYYCVLLFQSVPQGYVIVSTSYERFIQYNLVLDRDVALYALGVGADGADPCNPSELPFVYHPDGQSLIKVLSFQLRTSTAGLECGNCLAGFSPTLALFSLSSYF